MTREYVTLQMTPPPASSSHAFCLLTFVFSRTHVSSVMQVDCATTFTSYEQKEYMYVVILPSSSLREPPPQTLPFSQQSCIPNGILNGKKEDSYSVGYWDWYIHSYSTVTNQESLRVTTNEISFHVISTESNSIEFNYTTPPPCHHLLHTLP